MKILVSQIERSLGVPHRRAVIYSEPINIALARYQITTAHRAAAWLATVAHESARFAAVVERLNYSAEGLAATWPGRYAAADGTPNATANRIAHKPADIANLTYAGRMGNGSAGTGDGWRYRGRGLIQITGRDNYRVCGEALGLDLMGHPETLESPLYAALSAGWYWHANGLNALADRGNIRAITRRINGGLLGLQDRTDLYQAALAELGGT